MTKKIKPIEYSFPELLERASANKEELERISNTARELLTGFETLSNIGPSVSIFGSARLKPSNKYYKLAERTAHKMAEAGFAVITGAGSGIMEAANKGAKSANGVSIGLNIKIPVAQKPNKYLDILLNFKYFFARKVVFGKYAMAFIVFPGGFGTLDELFDALTLIQTHRVSMFPVVLVGKDYWKGLMNWLHSTVIKNGCIEPPDTKLFYLTDDPNEVVKIIVNFCREKYGDVVKSWRD